jgi:hypothetical protein
MSKSVRHLPPGKAFKTIDRRFGPRLSVAQVLAWADAFHRRTG